MTDTLNLANETLVQKHMRMMRAGCKHEPEALSVATYSGSEGSWTDTVCVDCGSHWRYDHSRPTPTDLIRRKR